MIRLPVSGPPVICAAVTAALASRLLWSARGGRDGDLARRMRRPNFAGRTVDLWEGVAAIGGTALATGAAGRGGTDLAGGALVAAVGALGLVDDLAEVPAGAKGLRGHLGALRHGTLTTGAIKAIGIPLLAVAEASARPRPGTGAVRAVAGVAVEAALTAGTANLLNLFDLRPGRALKAAVALAVPLATTGSPGAAAVAGTALSLGPLDLAERGMLGDAGANALGAALGRAAARSLPAPAIAGLLAVVVALTLASERVSFTRVIEATPALRALDNLGRRTETP